MTVYKITKVELSKEEEKMFEQVTDTLNGYIKKEEILPFKIYSAAEYARNAIEDFIRLVELCSDYADEYEKETEI